MSIRTKVHEDVYHWTEKGWTSHLDPLQVFSVGINYSLDSSNFRLLKVSIKWETMADFVLTHVMRNSAKPKGWEKLEVVVALEDVCNLQNSLLVFVGLILGRMQTVRIIYSAIWSCKINRHREWHLPSRSQIVTKVGIFQKNEVFQKQLAAEFTVSVKFQL